MWSGSYREHWSKIFSTWTSRRYSNVIYISEWRKWWNDWYLQWGLIKRDSPVEPSEFLPSFWETLVTSITRRCGRPFWSARPSFTRVMAFSYFLSSVYFSLDEFSSFHLIARRSSFAVIYYFVKKILQLT